MDTQRLTRLALLFFAGIAASMSIEPYNLWPLGLVALMLLFDAWTRAHSRRTALVDGLVFGLGLYGAGISFVYVALHDYGGMAPVLSVLVTLLAAAYLALFSALAGYVQTRLRAPRVVHLLLTLPALWTLSEWMRGTVFTGFPCMVTGYAHIESPLAGYAPLLGVYGVSLLAAMTAGGMALVWEHRLNRAGRIVLVLLATLWVSGQLLRGVEWTQPKGEPLKVALLQGNIAQELKFDGDSLINNMETYRRLVEQSDARLIVMPETAIPLTHDRLPPNYAAMLGDHARKNAGDVIVGGFEREQGQYYNSVYTLGSSTSQSYRKSHLVPFGEFIPLRPALGWLINEVLNIPMGDLARGDAMQKPLAVAGQQIAMDICYEDVFGEEIIRALPEATLLVNVTNDAWYGDSHAALQHNQVAQMRALESGRMMLRATNTGVTSVIDRKGRVIEQLPQHEEATLTAEVRGYTGSTPYVVVGNVPVMLLIFAMLGFAYWRGREKAH